MGTITEAASVLLARSPGSGEVFLVGRAPGLRFMGGFVAFPGGKVHGSDAALAGPDGLTPNHVAAVRELFEETGVLLARQEDGSFPAGGDGVRAARTALLAEEASFAEVLGRLGLHLSRDDLTPAGQLVTPPFAPLRFDTAFFVATLPPAQHAQVWPGELTEGRWLTAGAALAAWTAGSFPLSPPTVSLLECILGRPVAELPKRLRPILGELDAGRVPPIWFSPAVQLIPLFCQGLPPATHTNAWLVGSGPVWLIDPGPTDTDEQQKLFATLDQQAVAGRRLDGVILTHHHPDHIGAAAACASRYGVPIHGHPLTARALVGKVPVVGDLRDGDTLDLGRAPDGSSGWRLEARHTPGHAPGHLAFWEPHYRLLFAGDMVSTLSSVIIAPPEGDLAIYLDSLRRLAELPARLLLPAHGPVSARPGFVLEEALAHRRRREEQLRAALAGGPRTVAELAAALYQGLPEKLAQLAQLQVLAGLCKLRDQGLATEQGAHWQAPA